MVFKAVDIPKYVRSKGSRSIIFCMRPSLQIHSPKTVLHSIEDDCSVIVLYAQSSLHAESMHDSYHVTAKRYTYTNICTCFHLVASD